MARTLLVTLKARSGSYGPKSIRFEGRTYAELKERLASAHFPGFDEHAFVEVEDNDGQYVCFMDTEELPLGDIRVTVQKAPVGPPSFRPNRPEGRPEFGHPPAHQPDHSDFHDLTGHDFLAPWVATGHPLHGERDHHGHHHHHKHHDKHDDKHDDKHHGRKGRSPHRGRHGPFAFGASHDHLQHGLMAIPYAPATDPYLGAMFGSTALFPDSLSGGRGAHGPPHPPHGPPPHRHGRHRHGHGHPGFDRPHSPSRVDNGEPFAAETENPTQDPEADNPGVVSGGEEGGRWHGRFARHGGCGKGGMRGMRGRGCTRWGSPHGMRMRGHGPPGGHFHRHRGRSPSPPRRGLWRHQDLHMGPDFLPSFDRMSLNAGEYEDYAAADPAYQLAIARSYQDNLAGREATREEDWQEVGSGREGYPAPQGMY